MPGVEVIHNDSRRAAPSVGLKGPDISLCREEHLMTRENNKHNEEEKPIQISTITYHNLVRSEPRARDCDGQGAFVVIIENIR